jgi:hypothetical protein
MEAWTVAMDALTFANCLVVSSTNARTASKDSFL